ncbi:MAG: shikimate dehydrogenase [Verrucomicrobiales bacterium]
MMAWEVYSVADLERGLRLTPPARLAVFGDPVAHSRSPQLHNPALQACGIDAQYIRLHVPPADFEQALGQCRALGFLGTNCTIPHKFAALQAVDEPDALARQLGAVNTIVFRSGRMLGFNTDGPGLLRAVKEEFGLDLRDVRVLVIGAGGGAGRAAAIQCALERCPRLVLANRTRTKIESLARELAAFYPANWVTLQEHPDPRDADLVINATSVGMKKDDPQLMSPGQIESRHCVLDMIYSPPETALLCAAREQGARVANGLSMLLHQGAVSFEHWFQRPAPLEAMRAGLRSSCS